MTVHVLKGALNLRKIYGLVAGGAIEMLVLYCTVLYCITWEVTYKKFVHFIRFSAVSPQYYSLGIPLNTSENMHPDSESR